MHACTGLGAHQEASRPKGRSVATFFGQSAKVVARPTLGTTVLHLPRGILSLDGKGGSRCKRLQFSVEKPHVALL